MEKIELLSPAKTFEHGIEAINHGADAVYIGAQQFGARANAGNTIEDIEKLIIHAHQYYAKVYVTINTILTDKELEAAEKLIHNLYNIGTDALIIQDMGITQLNLPPIPLHASTQMDNRSVEKVKFLEEAGFEQVVLARELSIEQIKEIHNKTNVKLEGFVHGALCVCYSGQCYLSQSICGRSANRGVCAQLCRLPYTLKDSKGTILAKDKYLLSLKDFNLSNHLQELIEAGISSLKIEGRLKDINYVKNVTAYYRTQLDKILEGNSRFEKASSGKCEYTFIPNIEKSFHRGSTNYFLHGRNKGITSFDTPKSLGEEIGSVIKSEGKSILLKTDKTLNNGDGFCFLGEDEFHGFKANTVDGNRIFPAERIEIKSGTKIFRNYDQNFERILSKPSSIRKIQATLSMNETESGFEFSLEDEDNNIVKYNFDTEKTPANNKEKQTENLIRTLKKSGDTIFEIEKVVLNTSDVYFFPAATIAETRRILIHLLTLERSKNRKKTLRVSLETGNHPFPNKDLDYKANIHNQKAKLFYELHHVKSTEPSLETAEPQDAELMRCKHCIKYSLGYCSKEHKGSLSEPLILTTNTGKELKLLFDCKNCEMIVKNN